MNCIKCNGDIIGNGYSTHMHCENVLEYDCDNKEPDANTTYCRFNEEITIPIYPPDDLLLSMAYRFDHSLAVDGYYYQEFLNNGISHKEKLESAIRTMRQLHEEVVGTGFYKYKQDK